jgi:hypothetical protein
MPPSPHAPRLPPIQVVTDHPCANCGYNLRTMPLDARCPECGTPVGLSLELVGLSALPRKVVRPLYEGLRAYLACNVVLVVLLLCAGSGLAAMPILLGGPAPMALTRIASAHLVLKLAIWFVVVLRGAAGWLILTPGDGVDLDRDRIRAGIPMWVLIASLGLVVFTFGQVRDTGRFWFAVLAIFVADPWAVARVNHALADVAGKAIDARSAWAMALATDLQLAFCLGGAASALAFDANVAYWFSVLPTLAAGIVSTVVTIRLLRRLSRALAVEAVQQHEADPLKGRR